MLGLKIGCVINAKLVMSQPNEPTVVKIVPGKVKFSTVDEVAK